MPNRREFLKDVASGTAGLVLVPQAGSPVRRREVSVGGRRVKVVDVHGHCLVPEVQDVIKDAALAGPSRTCLAAGTSSWGRSVCGTWTSKASMSRRSASMPSGTGRIATWPARSSRCKTKSWRPGARPTPDRFVGLASVALQHPDLAAEQLDEAIKKLGLRGAAIGGSVEGEELSARKFDPFWAKAEELGIMIFVHPQPAPGTTQNPRLQGKGGLGNTIGNPLETTVFFSHLIFEGTLDRFPGLKICGAHGGGYLPSYSGRSDALCGRGSGADCKALKKRPSEYFKKELFVDTMVFHEEGLRHLVAEVGINQIVYGTDYPFDWPVGVDFVLKAAFLSNADKAAILGGNAARLLRIA